MSHKIMIRHANKRFGKSCVYIYLIMTIFFIFGFLSYSYGFMILAYLMTILETLTFSLTLLFLVKIIKLKNQYQIYKNHKSKWSKPYFKENLCEKYEIAITFFNLFLID